MLGNQKLNQRLQSLEMRTSSNNRFEIFFYSRVLVSKDSKKRGLLKESIDNKFVWYLAEGDKFPELAELSARNIIFREII